jgi:hypothetical protein
MSKPVGRSLSAMRRLFPSAGVLGAVTAPSGLSLAAADRSKRFSLRRAHGSRAILLFCAVAAALVLTTAPAFAKETHLLERTFGSTGHGSGELELASNSGVAVNESTHDIYVADTGNHRVDEFTATGSFLRAFGADVGGSGVDICTTSCAEGTSTSSPAGFEAPVFVAVDNSSGSAGDVYVGDTGNNSVTKFDPSGTLISSWGKGGQLNGSTATGPIEGPFVEMSGIAVDSAGNLDVLVNGAPEVEHAIYRFASDGSFAEAIATPRGSQPFGLAVDSNGNFFKANGFLSIEKFGPTGEGGVKVTFRESSTGLAVDTTTNDLYVDEGTSIARSAFTESGEVVGASCTPEPEGGCEPTETFGSGSLTAGAGLAVDGATHAIYAADPGSGQIAAFRLADLASASTGAATVTQASTGAVITLHGTVDPEAGPAASCHFEYVALPFPYSEEEPFSGATSVPCVPAGPFTGAGPIAVEALVASLPEAGYRYRLVATNEDGSAFGGLRSFQTFAAGLADGRAYELVSPAVKLGEVIPPFSDEELGKGVNPECPEACIPGEFDAAATPPMQATANGDAIAYDGEAFSASSTGGSNEYLARRGATGWTNEDLSSSQFASGEYQGYKAFSADLSRAVLLQFSPALSPEAPSREGKSFANLYLREPGGALQPLVQAPPPHRKAAGELNGPEPFRLGFGNANSGTAEVPAFTHIVFAANDSLTDAVPGVAPEAPEVNGVRSQCVQGAGPDCDLYEWVNGALRLVDVLPGNTEAVPGVIGSGCHGCGNEDLAIGPNYDAAISADGSRVFWSAESGQVYVRIDGAYTREVPDHVGTYLTAATDGSRVLLSDGHIFDNLAAEAPTELADLSDGHGGFEGILGAAADLSRVYYVDTAALTPETETNANGEHAVEGEDNLYSWHEGERTFIGILTGADNGNNFGDWATAAASRTAQVTPDGRYLTFMSRAPLTGYDNHQAAGGTGCGDQGEEGASCAEVFEYDASSANLSCASCDPTGARPLGRSNLSLFQHGEASELPPPANLPSAGAGRIFFESRDALAPRDVNGSIQDVYEWEPAGVGSCTQVGGCVSLLSGGAYGQPAFFVNSTPSGDDAFFATSSRLVSQDTDERIDLYDARVGGGFPVAEEAKPCEGEFCRGSASAAPSQTSAGSSAFSGPGNLAPAPIFVSKSKPKALTRTQKLTAAIHNCRKKSKKKARVSCEKQARSRYGPVKKKAKPKKSKMSTLHQGSK